MKKISKPKVLREMRAEYNFSKATRGQAYKPLHQGYTITIHNADGSTTVENYKMDQGVVILQPDVLEYFPDSDSVNAALRGLIALLPEKRKLPPKSRAG